MLFDIAGRLGRTVAELEDTLGTYEFIEWVAYLGLQARPEKPEPFYSDDPKVMADKMREILGPRRIRRKK